MGSTFSIARSTFDDRLKVSVRMKADSSVENIWIIVYYNPMKTQVVYNEGSGVLKSDYCGCSYSGGQPPHTSVRTNSSCITGATNAHSERSTDAYIVSRLENIFAFDATRTVTMNLTHDGASKYMSTEIDNGEAMYETKLSYESVNEDCYTSGRVLIVNRPLNSATTKIYSVSIHGDANPCDASAAPENGGIGDCTSSLASGSTCQPTCDDGYTVSGTSSCSLGTLTAATCSPTPRMWVRQQKLVADDKAPGDRFGQPVVISGDVIVIGSPIDDGQLGSAYVFGSSNSVWTEQVKLVADERAYQDFFGYKLGISEDTIVIGVEYDDDNSKSQSGSAYVFDRSEDHWIQQAKLTAGADAASRDFFGSAVAIFNDTIVVGAVNDDTTVWDSGSAYVFTRSDGNWSQQAKLTADDDRRARDEFGSSVAISKDTIVIGAHLADDDGADSGSTYVFTRSGVTWTRQAKLTAGSDGGPGDSFGSAVAISGEKIVIGAEGTDVNALSDAGAVYVFALS